MILRSCFFFCVFCFSLDILQSYEASQKIVSLVLRYRDANLPISNATFSYRNMFDTTFYFLWSQP